MKCNFFVNLTAFVLGFSSIIQAAVQINPKGMREIKNVNIMELPLDANNQTAIEIEWFTEVVIEGISAPASEVDLTDEAFYNRLLVDYMGSNTFDSHGTYLSKETHSTGGGKYILILEVGFRTFTSQKDSLAGMNAQLLYETVSEALIDAEATIFNTLKNEVETNVDGDYTGSPLVGMTNLVITPDGTYSVVEPDDDDLSAGQFAGVVIGIVVAFLVVLAICYFAVNSMYSSGGEAAPVKHVQMSNV